MLTDAVSLPRAVDRHLDLTDGRAITRRPVTGVNQFWSADTEHLAVSPVRMRVDRVTAHIRISSTAHMNRSSRDSVRYLRSREMDHDTASAWRPVLVGDLTARPADDPVDQPESKSAAVTQFVGPPRVLE